MFSYCDVVSRCAGQGGGSDPYSIQWNSFTDLMHLCKVPDKATCELKDLDTIFIATNVQVRVMACITNASRKPCVTPLLRCRFAGARQKSRGTRNDRWFALNSWKLSCGWLCRWVGVMWRALGRGCVVVVVSSTSSKRCFYLACMCQKYYKSKAEPTKAGAIQRFFQKHLLPYAPRQNDQALREELWVEEVSKYTFLCFHG